MHEPRTIPKTERLRHGWQFRRVFDAGRCVKGRLLVVYSLASPDEPRRMGVVTSRRVGNAVTRNRARRLLREAYRLHKHQLPDHIQLVMVARTAINKKKLRDVEAEMLSLWQKAGLISSSP